MNDRRVRGGSVSSRRRIAAIAASVAALLAFVLGCGAAGDAAGARFPEAHCRTFAVRYFVFDYNGALARDRPAFRNALASSASRKSDVARREALIRTTALARRYKSALDFKDLDSLLTVALSSYALKDYRNADATWEIIETSPDAPSNPLPIAVRLFRDGDDDRLADVLAKNLARLVPTDPGSQFADSLPEEKAALRDLRHRRYELAERRFLALEAAPVSHFAQLGAGIAEKARGCPPEVWRNTIAGNTEGT